MAVRSDDSEDASFLRFLYHTVPGRLLLRVLSAPVLSKAAGAFLSSPLSRPLIGPFVRKNHIDLSQCQTTHFRCFNDCFTRRLIPDARPVDPDPSHLIAPCDSYLSVFPISPDATFSIKNSVYTIDSLLGRDPQSSAFSGGTCLVFRLSVHHYHHYCYIDDGSKSDNFFIPGVLHTVRPIALAAVPIFVQNSREYTFLYTRHFDTVAQIEIGAMLVGKIHNLHAVAPISRAAEKGMFLYGGSTIVLLMKPGTVTIDSRFSAVETEVRMGQTIGFSSLSP